MRLRGLRGPLLPLQRNDDYWIVPARRRAVPGGQSDTRADPPPSLSPTSRTLASCAWFSKTLVSLSFIVVLRQYVLPEHLRTRAVAHPHVKRRAHVHSKSSTTGWLCIQSSVCAASTAGALHSAVCPPPKPHASRPYERVVDALLAEAHAHAALDREVIEVERIVGYTIPLFRAARSPVRRAGCRRSGRRHRANGSSPSRVAGHRPSFGAANGSSSSAVTSSATGAASGAGAKGSTSPP